jgi:hypothetical protein
MVLQTLRETARKAALRAPKTRYQPPSYLLTLTLKAFSLIPQFDPVFGQESYLQRWMRPTCHYQMPQRNR